MFANFQQAHCENCVTNTEADTGTDTDTEPETESETETAAEITESEPSLVWANNLIWPKLLALCSLSDSRARN